MFSITYWKEFLLVNIFSPQLLHNVSPIIESPFMYARIKQLHDCPLCCGYAGMWRHVFCVDWIQCILFFWSFLVVMSNPHRVLFLLMKHCCLSESQLSVYCCLCCTGYCGGCECSCWRFKKGSVSQTLFSPRRWLRCQCLCASEGLLILCLNFLKLLYLFGLNSEFTDVIFIRSVIIGLSRRHRSQIIPLHEGANRNWKHDFSQEYFLHGISKLQW